MHIGIKDMITLSTGERFENPKYLSKSQKKLARLHRELSRKPMDSANREKARIKLAREYDTICVEILQIQNMMKKGKFNASVTDASWGEFVRQLDYKCRWYGKQLIRTGKFYPGTRICGSCGGLSETTIDPNLSKRTCLKCGANHERAANAAANVLREGMCLSV